MKRRTALLGLTALAGCGFELRHEPVLPFKSLALTGFPPDSPLALGLKRQIKRTPVQLLDDPARAQGVPVYTWLGGAMTTKLSFNAWIGIQPPEKAAAETIAWQKRGFRSAKIKVGGGIEADRDRVKAVREAVGPDFGLRIDANAGYDVESSIKLAEYVAPCNLQLFEQPVAAEDLAGLARVRAAANAVGVKIMADEALLDHASLIDIIRAGAADMVKVKVMKQGGFLHTRRMIATAEAAGYAGHNPAWFLIRHAAFLGAALIAAAISPTMATACARRAVVSASCADGRRAATMR